ncbi:MAG TPA: AAA family ATPase [Thermoleophilaceae bacterium]
MGDRSTAEEALLGRERELAELGAAVEAAVSGHGAVCLLTGEPGIGKTSLAGAVAERAERRGALVRWGRAWEGGGAPAFWPWVQVVRELSRGRDAAWLRERLGPGAPWIAQVVPEVREQVPGIDEPGSLDTDQARFALFDAVATFLRALSAERPLALVLDDLHAADPSTLRMLEFACHAVRGAPILVLAAYQEQAAQARPEIEKLVVEVAREGTRVVLRRLDPDDVARLVERREGVRPEPALACELWETTEGNPFFASEVVRLLAVEGGLRPDGGRAGGPARIPLPDTVREAIRRRLAPLGPEVVETLGLAAVIGRELPLAVLERATGAGREELLDALDRASSAGLAGEVPGSPGAYRFAHGLVRETLYGDLAPSRRTRMHGAVGDALSERYGAAVDAHLAELAHHYLLAAPVGFAEKAVDYATRAGRRAMRLLAYEEAARLFEGALGALELAGSGTERRAELLLALGRARVRAGDGAARETLLAAAGAARSLDRPDLLAEAALAFRAFARQPGLVDDEVVALLEEALRRLDAAEVGLRARLTVRLAVQLFDRRDAGDRREELVDEAIAAARGLGDPATLAYVLSNAQLVRWTAGRVEECRAYSEEVLALAEETGDIDLAVTARSRQIDLYLGVDDLAGADLELEALDRLVRELSDPRAHAHVAVQRARRALIEGRFDDAERLMAEGEAHGERARDEAVPLVVAGLRWASYWSRGRLAELERAARQVADAAPGLRVWRAGLALVYCHQGREAEARRELDRLAARDFADIPRNDTWLIAMGVASEVVAHLGDERRAAALYELLSPFAGRNVLALHGAYVGPVSRNLALLAAVRRDWDAAEAHLVAARAQAERSGARPVLAMLCLEEARMLLGRGAPGDRERGDELLAEASERAAALGADGIAAAAAELRGGLSLAPAPAASLRREGDVWLFEYEGRSVRVRDSKGVRYLARLLASPGVEVHALELVGGEAEGRRRLAAAAAADAGLRVGEGDAGPLLDARAKAAYRERLEELREELEEAESWSDPERAARAREEIDHLTRELAGAVGLGGRDRRAGSSAERARVNATRSIRTALRRIADYSPDLGRELDATVRTGTFCAYEPDARRPVSWTIEEG